MFFASRDNHELEFPFWVRNAVEVLGEENEFEIIDCRKYFSELLVIVIVKSDNDSTIAKVYDYSDFLTFIKLP